MSFTTWIPSDGLWFQIVELKIGARLLGENQDT